MHTIQTELVVEQRALTCPCGWVTSVFFSFLDNQMAKRNVLY